MSASIDFEAFLMETVRCGGSNDIYLLLDHAGLDGLQRQLLFSHVEWKSLFEGTKEANATDVAPIVVAAARNGTLTIPQGFCRWLGERGTYSSSVIVLSSPLDLGSLSDRLLKRLDVKLSENMAALLRFFDPRVFEALMHTLTPEQRQRFLNAADYWWYVDRAGVPRSVKSECHEKDEPPYQLILSAEQEFAMVDACDIDQVLVLLRDRIPMIVEAMDHGEFLASVAAHIENAKEIGLSSIEDLTLYNIVVLSSSQEFTESSVWHDILSKTARHPKQFSDLILASNIDSDSEMQL